MTKKSNNYIVKYVSVIILFLHISSIELHAQVNSKSTEKFITVGNLQFRDFNRNGKLDVYEDFRKPMEMRTKALLAEMTMNEKLAQLKCPYALKTKLYPDNKFSLVQASQLFPNGVGQILRVSDGSIQYATKLEKTPNSKEILKLTNETQRYFINETRLGIPVLFLEEALHGLVVKDGTAFPTTLGMSSSWNEELLRDVYRTVASEARSIGIQSVLGPVVDLALDPRWGRTEETMGEDPYLVSRLGVTIVKALQGNSDKPDSCHVISTLKHIGAHGQSEGGGNTGPSLVSERQLREVNFVPFKAAILNGNALGIMPNYNEISGIPAHASKWLLTDVLRKEWGFKGVVISDYTATNEIKDVHHVAENYMEAGAMALSAGVDMELTDKFTFDSIPQAIGKKIISEKKLDEAVLRVLELKFRIGLFENPYKIPDLSEELGSKEHRQLALKAARQSMVLLKNENQLLPLDKSKYKKIAIVGPNANECILGGYSHQPRTKISPLAAIKEKYKDVEVLYAQGCKLNEGGSTLGSTRLVPRDENLLLIKEAVEKARNADVIVLMLGGNDLISKEATSQFTPGDLVNLELLGEQNELVDSLKVLNKPMVAFVFSGPPISFLHLTNTVSSIVQSWYLGQETGYAVAETLFGDNNPTGKLTISIPRSVGHLPDYYFMKPSSRIKGYNLESAKPLYPFGFGLSYTTYRYDNLKISKSTISASEKVTLTVDVTNTGKRAGEEIVQLYIRDNVSSITRPVKELKDFKRIAIKAGETTQISFDITPEKLKFYDIELKEVIEPGSFDIMVGPSSKELKTVKLRVL
jgi:beta-glucosidase